MTEVCFLNGNSTNLDPKKILFDTGDETLEQMLKNARPDVNKNNSYLIIGDEIIQDWKLPIGICKLLGENVLIFNLPYKTIKFNLENNISHEFYVPPDMNFGDLVSMIKNKTDFSLNVPDDIKCRVVHEIFQENEIIIDGPNFMYINIKTLTGKTVTLLTHSKETIESLKTKIEKIEGSPKNYQRLIFIGKMLEDDKKLSYYDLQNDSTIHLVLRLRGGGGEISFVDLSSSKGPKKIGWSKTGPKWRMAYKGLCLEGKCQNMECDAYDEMVIINMQEINKDIVYELGKSNVETNCPICDQHVNPETCAFNNCEWRCFGIKKENGELKRFKTKWKTYDDSYYRFDPNENGISQYTKLVIECKHINTLKSEMIFINCTAQNKELVEVKVKSYEEGISQDNENCPTCFQKYNDKNRLPLMLPCQHSCCSECLSRLYKNTSAEDQIECPICQTMHKIKLQDLSRKLF